MFCAQCGIEIGNSDSFCSKCGKPIVSGPPVAENNKKTRNRVWLWVLVGFVGLIVILIASLSNTPQTPSQSVGTAPSPASPKPRTGNIANDRLLAMTERAQAKALGMVVEDNCVGEKAFYMGWNHADQSAYWSVRCTSGQKYAVSIVSDSVGSTRVLNCSMLKLVANVNCFESLQGQ